ncbi:MAG TPA: ABC transporter permease [Terracidiphilus sp.]|nr:ABC transporter permease [Terracidiphilus sp.]
MKWWQLRRRDADLERELRCDLELEAEEQRERGLPADDARLTARRALGNAALIREQTHEAWGWAPLEHFWQDIHFAARQFSKNRLFAAICILTLGLGVGAQTTIYSVVRAVLIDPYPYRGAMRMVHIHLYDKDPAPYDLALDSAQFALFQRSPVLDGAIAEDGYTMALTSAELPEQLQVGRLSPNGFDYFGVPALLGRTFGPTDRANVAVLSYHFWISHFAGRPNAIGQNLQLDRQDYEIIGVMPQRFAWMGDDVNVPLPYSTDPRRPANVYARLREGVSDAQAEEALEPMLDGFAKETPANFPQQFKVHVVHINEVAIGRFRGFLVVLFASVSFLLVLACVNVAILLLARGEARQAEIAMRKALGASSGRIARQLLTESVFLSLAGGALGIALAFAGIRLVLFLIHPLPTIFPPEAEIALDVPVLLFSIGISSLTGIGCGLWPALRLCRGGLRQAAESGASKLAGKQGTYRAHRLLLTGQVTLTVLLLAGSGATVRELGRLLHENLGYEPQNLASANLVLKEGSHHEWADRVAYFEQIRNAIARDPEVVSAAIGHLPPSIIDSTPIAIPGLDGSEGHVSEQQVSREYFSTLGTRLLAGRVWTPAEIAHAAHLALINESMRRRYWPSANPIGQTIVLNNGIANGNVWRLVAPGDDQHFRIIGMVADTPNRGLGEAVFPGVYVPYSMSPFDGFDVVVRTRTNPAALLHDLKEDVRRVEAGQAVGDLVTANDLLEGDSLGRERLAARLFTAFAFLGLAFAISGLYSVQSYLVAQRRRELGLRIALGARRLHIVDVITRGAGVSVLIGTSIGMLATLALSRVFAYWTNGNARDPIMLLAIAGILFLAAGAASVGPVLTAAAIDPVRALRSE